MNSYNEMNKKDLLIELENLRKFQIDYEQKHNNQVASLVDRIEHLQLENSELKNSQIKIELSRDEYANAFDFSPVGLLTLTSTGIIKEINITCAKYFGLNREMLKGLPLSAFIKKNEFKKYLNFLANSNSTDKKLVTDEFHLEIKGQPAVTAQIFTSKFYYYPSQETFLQTTVIDITERKRIEHALIESEARFRLMADSSPVLIWMTDREKNFIYFNKQWLQFTGKNLEEAVKSDWSQNIHPEDFKAWKQSFENCFAERKDIFIQYRLKNYKDEYKWIIDYGVPRFTKEGVFEGYIGSCFDITKQKELDIERNILHEQILFQKIRLNNILTTIPGVVWEVWRVKRKSGVTNFISDYFEQLLGYKVNEWTSAVEFRKEIIHPDDRERVLEEYDKTFNTGSAGSSEFRWRHKNGEYIWIESQYVVVIENNVPVGLRGVNLDITKRKKYEREVEDSLKEKICLLSEVHHRVKNNLQIISSLLNLQANSITDEATREIFRISKNRIKSMALIHEKLYKTNSFSNINFKEYIEDITQNLTSLYSAGRDISINLDVQDVEVNIDQAITIGLTINELITNSLKYAFPKRQDGEISINMLKDNENLLLIIKDNGVGLPKDFNLEDSESLGLTLVDALVKQLNGELSILRNSGTEFQIKI